MSTPTIIVYGISNCDTVKKARAWLDTQGVPHVFHDFKKQGVPDVQLATWVKAVGLDDVKDELATALPYGKQRRLEIARALATDPKLLLLDEPAAGMNPQETIELTNFITHRKF